MIDLLYHATIYYEIRKYIQESEPRTLKYEAIIEKAKAHERNVLEYKDHQAAHGGANSAPSYNNPLLTAHALTKHRPSGRGNNSTGHRCGKCGKSHERGNCPTYGKTCNRCKGIITLKLFVVLRFQQRQDRALTKARSHRDMDRLGVTMANLVANVNTTNRGRKRSHQSRKRMQ